MSICTLSNKVFCLSAPWRKSWFILQQWPEGISDERYRERQGERESAEGKQGIEIYSTYIEREMEMKTRRNKECRSETDTKGSKDGFLADISNCTGSITTKLLIMHNYTRHLLSTLSGEVCVTHLQNDPVCMASWSWKITTSSLENIHFTKWKTKTFIAQVNTKLWLQIQFVL